MEKVKKIRNDPKLFIYEIRKIKRDLYFWGIATFIVLMIFVFICRKDASVFLTLSSMTQALSFIIIFLKVINFQNCSGISVNSLIIFNEIFICRILIIIFFSSDLSLELINYAFYFLSNFASISVCCYLLYLIYYEYPETSDIMIDNKIPHYYLSIPSFFLAILFKPYIFQNWFADLLWIYSIFLECIAVYPQIILFTNKNGQIESFTAHFIAFQGLSTIFNILFWVKNFYGLNDSDSLLLGGFSGYLVIISELVQLIIIGYFIYLYFQSLLKIKNKKKYDI